jgi:hypothetical protein
MSISGVQRYPNLQGMMDQFRSLINDDGGGNDGPQGGIIATNDAPFTKPFLNKGIRWLYRKLRNVGDPALILDNYLLLGLPALTEPNPAVQVSLGFLGYFDGFAMHSQWTLPAGAMGIDRVWERASGTGLDFVPVRACPDGLAPRMQTGRMREYEWRGNALWMPGALEAIDLRIRSKITIPPVLGPNLDFEHTHVPILDAGDAIVDRMLVYYAKRFAPEQKADAMADSAESLLDLQKTIGRQAQREQNARRDFGEDAVGNFAGWNNDL